MILFFEYKFTTTRGMIYCAGNLRNSVRKGTTIISFWRFGTFLID